MDEEEMKKLKEMQDKLKNMSIDEVKDRFSDHLAGKALHAMHVRRAIKETYDFSKELNKDCGGTSAIEACVESMVINAASELGSGLTDKEMMQLKGIAMRVVAEVIGEE